MIFFQKFQEFILEQPLNEMVSFFDILHSGVKKRHFHQIDLDDLNLLRNRFEIGIDFKSESISNSFFLFAHI
jgi:hypothetical protein